MDKYTFGDSRAAINLISILGKAENEPYTRKASRILAKYLKSLAFLSHIPNRETREMAYKLWRGHFIERIDCAHFPIIVETHLKSVLVGEFRNAIRKGRE